MSKKTIEVLVVDDSAFMRKMITDLLESNPAINVVGTARDGCDALDKIKELKPDLITLDIEMPNLDGLATLERIIEDYDIPVIMLSSLTQEGAEQTVKALEMGAFDFISKPSGSISLDLHKIKDQLLEKVIAAASNKGRISRSRERGIVARTSPTTTKTIETSISKEAPVKTRAKSLSTSVNTIVAIGTSTGGPRALQTVLTKLPADLAAPIVIVQHMPRGFTKSLADRLDSICAINVKEAENGMILENATAYIAPGGHQMSIVHDGSNYKIITDAGAAQYSGHKPSVDFMFNSIAELKVKNLISVIMTGMGGDGAKGLVKLKERQVYAIAEDESTCVVFGMPRVAIQTGLVDLVVPNDMIAEKIVERIS